MLQLKACLLLLFITTDTFLALRSNTCSGHMNLSQEPTGHLDFNPGDEGLQPPDSRSMVCTRTLDLPAGRTVLLRVVWLERGSNMSLVCSRAQQEKLAVGDTASLRGCDRNRATLTWIGAGHSSNAFQLFYYVQEEEWSSSVPHSQPDTITPNPATSTTEQSPLSGTFLGLSVNLTHPGLTQPSSPPSASANTDREASLFPGEASNNEPEASGTPLRTYVPGRPDVFSTQHTTRARSEIYTSQNAQFLTVSVPSEATSDGRVSSSAESYSNSQTLSFDKLNSLAMSSVEPLLETGSTVLPQNESKKKLDLTEKWESSGTHITESPRMQNTAHIQESSTYTDYLYTTRSFLHLRDHLSRIGSTKIPRVKTKSRKTHAEAHRVTWTAQSQGIEDSTQPTSLTFDPSENHNESTQETLSTENILRRQLSSLGSPPPRLEPNMETAQPYLGEKELRPFQASSSPNSASTVSTFGERSQEESTTSRHSMDLLTPSSYFRGHTTSKELSGLSTQPISTPVSGKSFTARLNESSSDGLSTMSLNTMSAQQHFKITTVNSEILPKTKSSVHTAASILTTTTPTLPHVSNIPYQSQTGLPTPTETGNKIMKETTVAVLSQRTPSWTTESVHHATSSTQPYLTTLTFERATFRHKPKYYIVPDEPVIIRAEPFELLLQILVEESTSSQTVDLLHDISHWLEPYLQRAPGFMKILRVWNSGRAMQCLVQFDTRGALQWLPHTGASSLLERTGLTRAVREGQSFRAATLTNITLGGVQEACGWLLQCPSGFTCAFDSLTSNYSCTSVCHSEYCQHHGLCTHHPAQPPVCRCVAGQDFWYMGPKCEVRMTRARLVLSCLGVLLLVLGVMAVLACMLVRRYRALLVQAKADQTRSSYRRFNHFDELSGRFWLRSGAGSADSLDNPAFCRSDEILQLRALERPCCYHDDSLSLPSTCPSPATHIRTIYPHSSQYAWRGSEQSVVDGVMDSGKASDLSVCSWPREPIQWSPFPLLQQLALQRPPAVRVARTRSYCDGMELVDVNKSWTA